MGLQNVQSGFPQFMFYFWFVGKRGMINPSEHKTDGFISLNLVVVYLE